MKLAKFIFDIPANLIAQNPSKRREDSKLMVVHRDSGKMENKTFKDILDYFDDKDVFVVNNTKVFPARMYGSKEKTGAKIEVFLLRELNKQNYLWDVIVDPARPSFSAPGLLKMDKVEDLYLQLIPHNSFAQLKTPLIVAATDIEQGEIVYFDQGELIRPLMASSCLPGIFAPVNFQKRMLVDGAVLNNLPIEPLLDRQADFLIASNCNPHSLDKPLNSTRTIIERSLLLAVRNKTQERLQRCDIVLEPKEVGRYDIFDVRKAREIFQIGYRCALKQPILLSSLSKK